MAKLLAQFSILRPLMTQSKSCAVVIPDPMDNLSSDSTPATDPANGLANLSHFGSD